MTTFRNLSLALLAGTAMLSAGTGFAQTQGSTKGPGVVVTATRVPTDPARVASSTTVITAEEIERRQFQSLPELLQAVPGLAVVRNGGIGQQSSIFSRGTESNHTLFLINGVEATDPSSTGGVYQFEHVLIEDIERVEVVRGPQSVLYGSDAIGAVVNIITKRGAGAPAFRGAVEGGSFGTISGRGGVSGAEGPLDYALNVNRFHTNGISSTPDRLGGGEDDGYDNAGVSANLGYAPSEVLTLRGFAKLVDSDTEIDPFLEDPDAHVEARQLFARTEADLDLLDGLWNPLLSLDYTRHDRNSRDFGTEDEFTGSKIKLGLQNDFYVSDEHTLTLGAESEWEDGESTAFDERVRNQSLFAQDQFAFGNRFVGAVGARLDHHSEFGSEVTWRVAPAYLIEETGTKLKASAGTGFKAPSLEDLFGGDGVFVVGNPDLQPEKSRGWDAGFEQTLFEGRAGFGATYFYNRIDDLIALSPTSPARPENVDEATTSGIEAFLSVQIMEGLDARIDYTFLKTEDETTGENLLRRPRHKINFDLSWRPVEPLTLTLDVLYVGERDDIDRVAFPTVRLVEDPYTLVTVAASWQAMDNLRLFGRVENLLDEEYENPSGFGQPGIGFFAGLEARL
jgi:vitamin B12 transporter